MGDRTPGTREQRRMSAAERAKMALDLRLARVGYDEIARRAGYASRGAAHKAVQRELSRVPREAAKALRDAELESLDLLESRLFQRALAGNLGAVDRVLKVKEQRAKLMGLHELEDESGVAEVKDALKAFRAGIVAMVAASETPSQVEPEGEA